MARFVRFAGLLTFLLAMFLAASTAFAKDRDDDDNDYRSGGKHRGGEHEGKKGAAPEISLAAAGSALALLIGGTLLLKGRRESRTASDRK